MVRLKNRSFKCS